MEIFAQNFKGAPERMSCRCHFQSCLMYFLLLLSVFPLAKHQAQWLIAVPAKAGGKCAQIQHSNHWMSAISRKGSERCTEPDWQLLESSKKVMWVLFKPSKRAFAETALDCVAHSGRCNKINESPTCWREGRIPSHFTWCWGILSVSFPTLSRLHTAKTWSFSSNLEDFLSRFGVKGRRHNLPLGSSLPIPLK